MKIKWVYVILFIVLLGAAVYMYMWSVGNEVGMHNVESVEEAVRVPTKPVEPDEPIPSSTPPSEPTEPVPSQDAPSPSLTQSIGKSLGLSSPTDTPPSTTDMESTTDKEAEPDIVDNLFADNNDSDSSQSESSSSSDSASSDKSESSSSLFS